MARRKRKAQRNGEHPVPDVLAWYEQPHAVFSTGNEVDLLRGGDELFPAMCESIEGASHDVWIATYIYHDDPVAQRVTDALCAAARRGVRVRMVIDGFGSVHSLARLQPALSEAGVQVAVFSPTSGWWNKLQSAQLRRLHQKLCVVDGRVGFVGGINVLDDRLDLRHGYSEVPRLDFAVRVRGPVVGPVEHTARAVWSRAQFGHEWRAEMAGLAHSTAPVVRARRLLRQARMTPTDSELAAELGRAPREQAVRSDPNAMRAAFVVRDNLRQRRTIERSYIEAIRNARGRVDIVCAYFYPGRAFLRVLQNAANRGVRIRLLLQGKLDYQFAGMAAHVFYEELLARRVRIYEYTPAFLHAKVALVDDEWATVGSSNIDPLSLVLNLEANVIVRDRAFVETLAFEIDRAVAASREVTSAPGGNTFWGRVRRGFVSWCARLYLRAAGAARQY